MKKIIYLTLSFFLLLSSMGCGAKKTGSQNSDDFHLSDDLLSCQIMIEDVLYSLPASPKDFINNGWELMNSDEMLDAGNSTSNFLTNKNQKVLMIRLCNSSDENKPLIDCMIDKLSFQPLRVNDVILPKCFVFDNNTNADTIMEYYGEADSIVQQDDITIIKYKRGENSEVMFTIFEGDKRSDSLISIRNM